MEPHDSAHLKSLRKAVKGGRRSNGERGSEGGQIAVELPGADRRVPVEELLALEVREVPAHAAPGHVQGAADDVVRLEGLDRVQQGRREFGALAAGARLAGVEIALDAVESGGEGGGSGEVGVGGAVSAAQLDAVAVGDADEVGAVVAAVTRHAR